ncbi:MAG: hypothetical protein KA885_00290 [Spirochaetes bacterium]|nr:hypothetical protein [Spirochaetota bacterium]
MKKNSRSFLLLVVMAFLISVFISNSCVLTPLTTSWNISGVVKFPVDSTGNNNIKLCAYYTGSSLSLNTSSVIVSNVVSLGDSSSDAKPFSLNIDASGLSPSKADYIKLVIWEDDNSNDKCDIADEYGYALTSNQTSGCSCFGPYVEWLNSCNYYYDDSSNSFMGTEKGWNQKYGDDYKPLDQAVKVGATIEYEGSL